jgi:hypothetical protein
MFEGLFLTSISIRLSFSFQSALLDASMSAKVESPTSSSAFAHAWSTETNETPTRRVISFGVPR